MVENPITPIIEPHLGARMDFNHATVLDRETRDIFYDNPLRFHDGYTLPPHLIRNLVTFDHGDLPIGVTPHKFYEGLAEAGTTVGDVKRWRREEYPDVIKEGYVLFKVMPKSTKSVKLIFEAGHDENYNGIEYEYPITLIS